MSGRKYPSGKLGVTMKQHLVLEFVKKYCAEKGYSPSYQEIGESVGIASKSGVKRMIDALVDRGHLELLPRRARSLAVIEKAA
jgi:repressor LexA